MLPSPSRLRPYDYEAPVAPRRGVPELRLVPRENRIAVMLNANAKKVNDKVKRQLSEIVPQQDLFYCRSLEEAQSHADAIIDRRYGTVVLGGGDGTIANSINMLLEAANRRSRGDLRHGLPDLAVLRLGTGNGLANMCGAGNPMQDTAVLYAGERPKAHTLRLLEDSNGTVFPFASLGYDAQVLNDFVDLVDSRTTKWGRTLAKSLPGYLYAIGTRTIPTEIKAERARMRIVATGRASILDPETAEEIPLASGATLFEGTARAACMGTSPFYGYGIKAMPHALRRSDRFHLRVSNASVTYLLSRVHKLWKGTLKTTDIVDFLVEGVTIESSVDLPMQTAGDAKGRTRTTEVRLSDRAFRLLEGTGKVLS